MYGLQRKSKQPLHRRSTYSHRKGTITSYPKTGGDEHSVCVLAYKPVYIHGHAHCGPVNASFPGFGHPQNLFRSCIENQALEQRTCSAEHTHVPIPGNLCTPPCSHLCVCVCVPERSLVRNSEPPLS